MELLKGLIKWIILIILFIIIVVLIVKFANRSETSQKKVKEPTVNIVDNNTNTETDNDDNTEDANDGLEPIQNDLTVDSPDTASTGVKETILGIIITSYGFVYIYKRRSIKGNS